MLLDNTVLVNDPKIQQLLNTLEQQIKQGAIIGSSVPLNNKKSYDKFYVSPEYLEEVRNREGPPLDTNECSDLLYLNKNQFPDSLMGSFWKHYPNYTSTISGHFIYPERGYMGWHTNAGSPGIRIYLAFVPEGHKSFFRYYDESTKTIVDSYDEKGWNMRAFLIDPIAPFWHCVYSDTQRYSFGIKLKPILTM